MNREVKSESGSGSVLALGEKVKTTHDLSLMTALTASLRSSVVMKFRSTVRAAPLAFMWTMFPGWSANMGMPTIGTPW